MKDMFHGLNKKMVSHLYIHNMHIIITMYIIIIFILSISYTNFIIRLYIVYEESNEVTHQPIEIQPEPLLHGKYLLHVT